jgi:plastocyanin
MSVTQDIGRLLLRGAPALLALLCTAALAQAVRDVAIRDYRFEPAEVQVRAGETVRWTNDEKRTSHSVIFPAEGGLESVRMFPGESWERRFDKPGRYEYRCGPHPEMRGTVVVGE